MLRNSDNPKFEIDSDGQWWYWSKVNSRQRAFTGVCRQCGTGFLAPFKKTRTCSPRCAGIASGRGEVFRSRDQTGSKNVGWKGGRTVDGGGYVRVLVPEHPTTTATKPYVLEHRLVMEKVLGRYLHPYENVHHINGVKDDNRPENLELWSTSQPKGQRVSDKIAWAEQFLQMYGYVVQKVDSNVAASQ